MYSLLHPNCHHQINHEKFNLKFHYPRPFEWKIYHCEKANVDHISRAIDEFSCEKMFCK